MGDIGFEHSSEESSQVDGDKELKPNSQNTPNSKTVQNPVHNSESSQISEQKEICSPNLSGDLTKQKFIKQISRLLIQLSETECQTIHQLVSGMVKKVQSD